jgi:predicted transcriptional regulator
MHLLKFSKLYSLISLIYCKLCRKSLFKNNQYTRAFLIKIISGYTKLRQKNYKEFIQSSGLTLTLSLVSEKSKPRDLTENTKEVKVTQNRVEFVVCRRWVLITKTVLASYYFL